MFKKVMNSKIQVGAQNCHESQKYASLTGQINSNMLKDAGAKFVILGHSENRQSGEENKLINKKILVLKIILVSVLASIAILSLPILVTKGNTHFKHALEWNYFVGVVLFYLFSRFFWRRTL